MFNLEQAIAKWRQQMRAAGIKSLTLDELESHLWEDVQRQIQSGMHEQRAFEMAAQEIGSAASLKAEFAKIGAEWNRPMAWAAWISFAVSLVLPAYADGQGWKCAGLSATAISWSDFWHNWQDVHFESLTFANLLMLASMFLIPLFSHRPAILKWLRWSAFVALALVWSFVLLFFAYREEKDLKIGCYVWSASFLLLFLSTFNIRRRKMPLAA